MERLFVYGTLHPESAPDEVADIVRRFKPLGQATVRGHLYDLGDYPAVVLDQKGDAIQGVVFILPNDKSVLERLDAYEEYTPSTPKQSLFIRKKTKAELSDGSRAECWIYVYNRPIARLQQAPDLASVA